MKKFGSGFPNVSSVSCCQDHKKNCRTTRSSELVVLRTTAHKSLCQTLYGRPSRVQFVQYRRYRVAKSYTILAKFKFKFNEATPRGVPGPVFKKTPEMPGFTKMTPPRLPAGMRSLCTSTSPPLHYQCQRLRL